MVGIDYTKPLIDFERYKTKELYYYSKKAEFNCVRIMHERVSTFMRWMGREDKGCLPLTFMEDVHPSMTEEELGAINNSYIVSLDNRF